MGANIVKKTSLRKNRFSAHVKQLSDNVPARKLSAKLSRRRTKSSAEGISLKDMMMQQWECSDADIAERMAATLSRPVSPQAEAFYKHIDAVPEGRAAIGDPFEPAAGQAA